MFASQPQQLEWRSKENFSGSRRARAAGGGKRGKASFSDGSEIPADRGAARVGGKERWRGGALRGRKAQRHAVDLLAAYAGFQARERCKDNPRCGSGGIGTISVSRCAVLVHGKQPRPKWGTADRRRQRQAHIRSDDLLPGSVRGKSVRGAGRVNQKKISIIGERRCDAVAHTGPVARVRRNQNGLLPAGRRRKKRNGGDAGRAQIDLPRAVGRCPGDDV